MFGMGMSEIIVILVIALIVIGPKKLPEIAKSLGKAMGEFKRATNDLKDSISIDDPPRTYKPVDVYATDRNKDAELPAGQVADSTPDEIEKQDGEKQIDETGKEKQ